MKYLIFGLGNIGDEYHETRHNIGFMVLDSIAKKNELTWKKEKYASVCEWKYKGRNLILLKPDTYMNVSGKAVRFWMQKEKINAQNVLIITDDLALPTGKLRLKMKGSDGGHNGLKSIQADLQTQEFPRLRFGIGNNFTEGKQVNYVLGKFTETELEKINESIEKTIVGLQTFVTQGASYAMTYINA